MTLYGDRAEDPAEDPAPGPEDDSAGAFAPAPQLARQQQPPQQPPRRPAPPSDPPQPSPDLTPRQVRPEEIPPPPPRVTAGRGRGASDSAVRKLPADHVASVPCATCPPRTGIDVVYDGALIGAGCQPYSGRGHAADVARARRAAAPADAVAPTHPRGAPAVGPPSAAGSGGGARSRAAVERPSSAPIQAEMRAAFAHPVTPDGPCCAARLAADTKAGRSPRTILYVNGIQTDLNTHCCSLRSIASTACARVVGVFNASTSLVGDLWQSKGDVAVARAEAAGQSTDGDEGRNPAVDAVQAVVEEQGRTGEPLEVWAHSQGGATTSAALFRAKRRLRQQDGPAPVLSNVTVNSFGSAAALWPDGPTYTHHIHEADPVAAHLAGSGVGTFLARSGLGDAGLGLGPFGERDAGRGATVVYADGPVPRAANEVGTYTMRELRLPDPTWRKPVVPGEGQALAFHSFDSSYLPLYRERARAAGRADGCSPPSYPFGDPCGPAKPPKVAPAPATTSAAAGAGA